MSAIAAGPTLDPDSGAPVRWTPPWWLWAVAAAAIFAAGATGVLFAPSGSSVAVWWPAAGLSVLFGILHDRRRVPWAIALVLVVTAAANLLGGRAPGVALLFGVANAVEVAIVVAILGTHARRFVLSSLQAAVRLCVAVAAGAVTAGALVGSTVALVDGGALWPTAGFVAASHAAAVSMIAPLGALPRPLPVRASRTEMVVQAAILVLVVVVVFRPGATLPIDFLPYAVLAWAAFRFPIRVVYAESLLASLAILLLTIVGGGPFRAERLDVITGAALVELFLVTFAGFSVLLAAAQYELRAVSRRLDASTRLLSGSVTDAQVGLAIVRAEPEEVLSLTWGNAAARAFLDAELGPGDRWEGPTQRAAVAALGSGDQMTVRSSGGRTMTVVANAVDGDAGSFAIQMLDVTTILRAQQAQLEAEMEHEAARSTRLELERQRDDFLATTSHELRTPITSIVGYTELLADAGRVDPTERAWLDAIERNALRLSELVEDLLMLSSASAAAPMRSRRQRVRCDELVEEAVGVVRVLAERKGQRLSVEVGEDAVLVVRSDIVRAVVNLAANAIKFTPEGGGVAIAVRRDGDAVLLSVADTGPGMSDEAIPHAFERFYRAPEAERDSIPGTGLGLAIVAELVRRNGGSAAVRRNEHGGLTAEVRLPAAPVAAGGAAHAGRPLGAREA